MEILLVEDDLEDAGLTIETLREGQVPCRVSLVRDGEEALAFLRREAHFARVPRPDMILLDMQMPKKDGRAVLAEIRRDPELCRIPSSCSPPRRPTARSSRTRTCGPRTSSPSRSIASISRAW